MYIEEDTLKEVIAFKLSKEAESVQGFEGTTPEYRIYCLIRDIERSSYSDGIMKVRGDMKRALGL